MCLCVYVYERERELIFPLSPSYYFFQQSPFKTKKESKMRRRGNGETCLASIIYKGTQLSKNCTIT